MTRPPRRLAAARIATALVFLSGCQSAPRPVATRSDVERLMVEAMTTSDVGARSVAALAAADRATGPLTDTLRAVDRAREVVQRNIANADTTGYKRIRAFALAGGKLVCQLDDEQGSLASTNRRLDLAIQGPGFLRLKLRAAVGLQAGIGYTRNGNLFVDKDGQLAFGVSDGCRLMPPISIPRGATDIDVTSDGNVKVTLPGSATPTMVGQLKLTRFANPDALDSYGGGVYLASEASGPGIENVPGEGGAGSVLQGFLEGSNVDLDREAVRLQFLDRWRATLARAAQAADGHR